jgi:hypothetical protein
MDSLLDLLFGLLALAGKYWFVVLGYAVYRLLGLDKKKNEKGSKRTMVPPLTPTSSGGQSGRMTVGPKPAAAEPHVYQPESTQGDAVPEEEKEEWKPIPKASLTDVEENGSPSLQPGALIPVFQDAAPIATHVPVEPVKHVSKEKVREGMKWSIILSQPRSKAPYQLCQGYKSRSR